MYTEIEAKLKVESLKDVERNLAELGAEFLQEQLQTDCYFDDANRTLTKTDKCLRLRRQLAGNIESLLLTYKGAKGKNEFKKRPEIQIEVKDADSVEKLFSALGYEKALVFEKKRRVWRLGECEVALDRLPLLGAFVEIEGPDTDSIAGVQKSIELSDMSHIPESYACLMDEKLHQLGKKERQVFL